jgi:kynurenine formamidase
VGTQDGDLTKGDFDALYAQVRHWDEPTSRGALEHLTPDQVIAAARLVQSGFSVGLALPLSSERRPDNPTPPDRRMTALSDGESGGVQFVKDYVGLDYHNDGLTHLDALSHVSYDGRFFGGVPDSSADEDGTSVGDVLPASDGIVGRGVLLDIPRLRAVPWLEPGDQVRPDELLGAEEAQGVRLQSGDIAFVRSGHTRRLAELGPWDTPQAKAGLHPTVALLFAQRRIAVLGCDTNSDAAPCHVEDVAFPLHVLMINALGVYLLDYLWLDDLAAHCEREQRWEFLAVIAPLRIPGGTGSPVNPIAVF